MGGAQEEYTNEFIEYIEFEDEIEDYPYWLVKCYSTRREAEKCYNKAVELNIPAILFEPLRRDLYYAVALYGDDKRLIEIGIPGVEAYAGQVRVMELLRTHLIKTNRKKALIIILTQLFMAFYLQNLIGLDVLWLVTILGAIQLMMLYVIDKELFNLFADHIVVVNALVAASIISVNPLTLILTGIGSALFLLSAILYPSEREKTKKLYKSCMVMYSIGIIVMSLIDQ